MKFHPDDVKAVLASNRPRLLGIAADIQAATSKLTEQEMKPNGRK